MSTRFIAVVMSRRVKPYRILDQQTRQYYAEGDDLNLIVELAAKLNAQYNYSRLRRFFAWLIRRPLAQPTPDPISEPEPVPEWKQRIHAINALVAKRRQEYELAKGGRLVLETEFDTNATTNLKGELLN